MNHQSDILKQSCTALEKESLENICPGCGSLVSTNVDVKMRTKKAYFHEGEKREKNTKKTSTE